MNLNARCMTQEPESVEEAWRWIDMILGANGSHGETRWHIQQEMYRVRMLCLWIRGKVETTLPR